MADRLNNYTRRAVGAVVEAVRDQDDFGGWLAEVLAIASAELGSTAALTAGRPGSWEAGVVEQLVRGTVGWEDEYPPDDATGGEEKTSQERVAPGASEAAAFRVTPCVWVRAAGKPCGCPIVGRIGYCVGCGAYRREFDQRAAGGGRAPASGVEVQEWTR